MEIAGATLEVVTGGAGDGPQLVFLHEGLGSVAHWKTFPHDVALTTGCPFLCYSRRGHGSSARLERPRAPDFMHLEATGALAELLSTQRGPRVLVGHSDGASIALLYAALVKDPNLVGVVTLAPHVFVEAMCVDAISAARDSFSVSDLRDRLARYHDDVDHTFFAWADIWVDPAFRQWTIEALLPRIDVPVLVIQGVDDSYGTLAQVDAVAAGCSGPVDRVILDRCDHSPPRERPHLTRAAIAGFVAAHRP